MENRNKRGQPGIRKIQFAIEYYRCGNGTEACRKLGYKAPEKAASRLKKDKAVKEYLKQLDETFNLRRLAEEDLNRVKEDIAGINEVLATFTRILRGEETEETVVVLKAQKTSFEDGTKTTTNEEHVEKVETKTRNMDRLRAGENLMKYYAEAEKRSADECGGEGGVVILAEIKE